MKRQLRLLGGALPLIVILVAAVLVRGDASRDAAHTDPADYAGTLIDPPTPIEDFTLRSADGEVSLSDFEGRYVVVFFGYTSCPDICPMTLARVTSAIRSIGPEAEEEVHVVLVTVDPERDTPERLDEYTSAFGANVSGLTGTLEELESVASSFGMYFEKVEGSVTDEDDEYLVDHSATTTVIDRQGHTRLLWSPMHGHDEMESDLRRLLDD